MTRLSALLADAGVTPLAPPRTDPEITGVELDSRRIARGHLFLALPGEKADGVSFVPDARARGAVAVLAGVPSPADPQGLAWAHVPEPRRAAGRVARAWHGRPDASLSLVGVTGTNGKTTVTFLVEAIARAAGRAPGRIGTVGYAWGGREVAAPRTTPEATELFALLARMRDEGVDLVAMEVSSHALELGRVEGAIFRVAAFLNLGRDHLDFHGTPEAYFEAKARLFTWLRPDDTAVLPADRREGERLARRTAARVLTFGRGDRASVRLREEQCGADGSVAVLDTPAGPVAVRLRLPGRVNLENAAAAAACALGAGIGPEAIESGLAALESVPGRWERVDAGQPFAVFVDYAHTGAALESLLAGAREIAGPGRVTVMFGCGGDRDPGKRPEMGRTAAAGADRVVLTSDNPRGEDPAAILEEIRAGVASVAGGPARCVVEPDRGAAIREAIAGAAPGDVVLLAGKGHETGQTAGGRTVPFDDREEARRALASLGFGGGGRGAAV